MDMSVFHGVFDTIEDFVDVAKKHPEATRFGEWAGGVTSMEECAKLAYHGWEAGAQRAKRLGLDVQDRIESLGLDGLDQHENYDVSGAFVDVGAFCSGEPECMVEYEEQLLPRQRTARIFVQLNYNGDVQPERAERRGVAIAAIVDALEAHGMQCEVWGVDWVYLRGGTTHSKPAYVPAGRNRYEGVYRHAIRVKRAGQLMPLDRIAFAIGHPAFFRNMLASARKEMHGFTFGAAASFPDRALAEPGDLCFTMAENYHRQWASDVSALEWAMKMVSDFVAEVTK